MRILPSNRNFSWVITPYRELISGTGLKNQVLEYTKTYETKYVCIVNQQLVSLSDLKGYDFAVTLQQQCPHDSYIYIDQQKTGYLFVHIYKGKLLEDRIINDFNELIGLLNMLAGDLQVKRSYHIETFAVDENLELTIAFNALLDNKSSVLALDKSLMETLEASELFSFVGIKVAERSLTDKSKQNSFVLIGLCLVALVFLGSFTIKSDKQERIVLNDIYKDYSQLVTTEQSASIMLAQDYNMHQVMKRYLDGWKAYKVTYSAQSIKYSVVLDYGSPSNLKTLRDFAHNFDLKLVFDTEGTHLVSPIIQKSPYTDDLFIFNLDTLVASIVDNTNEISPFITFQIEELKNHGEVWGERDLAIKFKGAVDHDLLRLAAVLDGYPQRYPVVIKDESFYQVDPNGNFSEGLKLSVIGDFK